MHGGFTKAAVWGLLLLAAACSADALRSEEASAPSDGRGAEAPKPAEQIVKSVGSEGGAVTTSTGSGVEVPEGALPDDVQVSVTEAPQAPSPFVGASPVATPLVMGPSGLQFAQPVKIVLRIDPSKLPPGTDASKVVVFTAPDGTTDYRPLATSARDAFSVVAETTHFSVFIALVPPPDADIDAGGPKPEPQTCAKRLCGFYGPGACGVLDDGCSGKLDCPPCKVEPDAGSPASGDGGSCMPLRCGNYPKACGRYPDGCGSFVDCKDECGGGGPVAGTDGGVCTPRVKCGDATVTACGVYFNGCFEEFCGIGCTDDGGKPSAGSSPDAGACAKLGCASYPNACGRYPDGCDGFIDCRSGCTAAGSADAGTCTPRLRCGDANVTSCGTFFNGCSDVTCMIGCPAAADGGAPADAGTATSACTPTLKCGDPGVPRCGSFWNGCANDGCKEGCTAACEKVTCSASMCGPVADGCGGMLDCPCVP